MHALLLLLLQSGTPAPATAVPQVCSAAEYRQFDFWVGDWEVRNPQGRVVGHNRITPVVGGCALREEWTSADGTNVGTSLNAYNQTDRRWHQSWVDNAGTRLDLVGGLRADAMVLEQRQTRDPSGDVQRITWTPLPVGRVRQHWQSSKDGGTTWTTAFDGTYARRPLPPHD